MSREKKAVIANNPKTGKTPKVDKNPESYIKMPISWQFSLMDFDFEYGWGKVIDRIEFSHTLKGELLLALADSSCTEKLYNLIDKLNPTDYDNIHEFFNEINNVESLSSEEFSCILKIVHQNFFWNYLFPLLQQIESKKWFELEKETHGRYGKSKHHWVDVKDIIKPARSRLTELKMDDHDQIYSLRLTGTQRIWGIRQQSYFRLLWFDFDHKICPSLRD
jgi:hypothetical protein